MVSVSYANLSSTITCTATYDGVSMTHLGQVKNTSFESTVTGYVDYFQLTGIPTGSGKTVAITFSAGGNVGDAFCVTYSGVNQSTPCGTLVTGTGAANPASITVSITSGNMGINTFCGDAPMGTATANRDSIFSLDNSYTAAIQDTSSIGSINFDYSYGATYNWSSSGIEILAGSGGGAALMGQICT
jgi:hypothetical protein